MGLTQEELAARAGMDYKYLGAVERGERNITIDNIEKIVNGLGLEPYQLFLFSLKDEVKQEETITEDKVMDILERCDASKKRLILRVIREIAKWEEKG